MQNNARDITLVYNQVIEIIPNSNTELINDLKKWYKSIFNVAPELMNTSIVYRPFLIILNNHMTEIDKDTQEKINTILLNKNNNIYKTSQK